MDGWYLKKQTFSLTNNKIYVVGFPKSGNSWLTRLIAHLLQVPVKEEIMENTPEMAAEINVRLGLPSEGEDSYVAKVHYLSSHFLNEIDPSPRHIIYVYRDIRDVAVSAFFYFNQHLSEEEFRIADWKKDLGKLMKWSDHKKNRKRLEIFIEKFCRNGMDQSKFGNWQEHVEDWLSFKLPDTTISYVSYEALLQDTASCLRRIIDEQEFNEVSASHIQKVVEAESFKTLKSQLSSMEQAPLKHNKDWMVKFMRKGKSGDWKNFLDKRMLQIIQTNFGETMSKLDYTNP